MVGKQAFSNTVTCLVTSSWLFPVTVQNIDAIIFDGKTVQPTSELIAKASGLAKPDAVIIIQNIPPDLVANTEFLVRTNGLVNPEIIQTEKGQMTAIVRKPKYDVGSATKLNLSRKPAAAVWKLDGDDDETIDPDELLDEEDYAKPDPTSLRGKFKLSIKSLFIWKFWFEVCGTTGKRKACKDCTCGLADELDNEAAIKRGDGPKSSCGSVRFIPPLADF